jgi:hypothetical protein
MTDSGDPKQDKDRELRAEREHYQSNNTTNGIDSEDITYIIEKLKAQLNKELEQ